MSRPTWLRWLILGMAGISVVGRAQQQVTVTTPLIGVRDQFYEHFGVGWGLRGSRPGSSWFLNYGGPMSALPPFGGYAPGSGLQFGMGRTWPGGSGYFNFIAESGSQRTLTMSAPSVTLMNGSSGSIFDGTLRPFVTGLVPVVGGDTIVPYAHGLPYGNPGHVTISPPVMTSPLAEKLDRLRSESPRTMATRTVPGSKPPADAEDSLNLSSSTESAPATASASRGPSSAEQGDLSVAEIRRLNAAADARDREELDRLIREAQVAEQAREWAVARVRYQQAAAKATGDQRQELLDSLRRLKSPGK